MKTPDDSRRTIDLEASSLGTAGRQNPGLPGQDELFRVFEVVLGIRSLFTSIVYQ